MRKLEAAYKSLLKVSGDLRQRTQSTGQQGRGFLDLDWERMYPAGPLQRNFRQQQAFEFVGGPRFSAPPSNGGGGGGRPPNGGNGGGNGNGAGFVGGVVRQVAGAGLNAMGAAGRVANGALGAGMSGGVMAGLAGLGGGLAALAIGKAVGAVVEKVGAVEIENIKHDRIKRQLGDVGVGFGALKAAIRGSSSQMGLDFSEGQDLVAQYVRQSGISNRGWRGVGEEVATAGNFGRSFGMDQAASVGAFGTMRQFGVTGGDQDARKMALLIGEGIARSGAFAKSEEFLQAIAGYTEQAAHSGMNAPNTAAYAAMLSGMVGSKIPGMDVQGSAVMIGKVDAAIRAGGADEAGQNFMYRVLGRKGWDPIDARLQQEQGMFGSPDKTFGEGSVASRYYRKYGIALPAGAQGDGKDNYTKLIEGLEAQYSGGPEMKKLMASAFARQTGMNITQAMAMLTVGPAQLGGMGKRLDRLGIDVKDVNATGISRMAQIEGDSSLSEGEKDKRMRQAATEGQEQTAGSIAKDSKAALENIKSTLADKLLPATQAMRDGIMYLAGGKNGMSTRDIRVAMMAADSDDRARGIGAEFDEKMKTEAGKPSALRSERAAELAALKRDYDDPEKRAAHQKRIQELSDKLAQQEEVSRKGVLELMDGRKKALADNAAALQRETKAMDDEEAARRKATEAVEKARNGAQDALDAGAGGVKPTPSQVEAMAAGRGSRAARGAQVGSEAFNADAEAEGLSPEMRRFALAVYGQESGGGANTATSVNGAVGDMQMLPSTFRGYADKGWDISNPSHNRRTAMRYLKDLAKKSGGNLRTAAGAYDGGEKAINPDGSLKTYGNLKRPSDPNTQEYADQVMGRMGTGTPIPDTGKAAARDTEQRHTVMGAVTVTNVFTDPRGNQIAPPSRASARISTTPSGIPAQ